MNFKYLCNRFNTLYSVYQVRGGKLFCLIDYFIDFIVYGASLNDYFAFGFYKMRPNWINEYITYRRYHKIQYICNHKDYIKFFRDKSMFIVKFKDYLRRETLDLNDVTEDEFLSFCSMNNIFFVKEVLGFRGNSVFLYNAAETDLKALYYKLKNKSNAHFIVESKLTEHEALASFHPASVNTIRIVTVYDNKSDVVHFMFAKIRLGNNGAFLDNTHAGGISGNIDIDTGIINTPGYSVKTKEEYIYHPVSHKQIIGFKIPYWEQCKDFVEKAARVVPEVRYVGWDVVLLEDGSFALIEANDNADHDGQQIHYKGLWKDYKSLINKL